MLQKYLLSSSKNLPQSLLRFLLILGVVFNWEYQIYRCTVCLGVCKDRGFISLYEEFQALWGWPNKTEYLKQSFLFFNIYLFIWLHWVLVAVCRITDLYCIWTLSCSMLYLAPQPEMEHQRPELGVQSLSHWTTREVLDWVIFNLFCCVVAQSCPALMQTPGL